MEWRRIIVLSLILLIYSILGAFMFLAVEGPNLTAVVQEKQHKLSQIKSRFSHLPEIDVEEIIEDVLTVTSSERLLSNETETLGWNFVRSFYFVGAIISTIGYGDLVPLTALGRLLCILYALPAIPLNIILLAGVGTKLNEGNKRADAYIKNLTSCPKITALTKAVGTWVTGWITFVMLPAVYWTYTEAWPYLDSVYFSFTTLATIGFGDLTPDLSHLGPVAELWRMVVVVWVWIGLAWVSWIISSIQEYIAVCHETSKCPFRNNEVEPQNIFKGSDEAKNSLHERGFNKYDNYNLFTTQVP